MDLRSRLRRTYSLFRPTPIKPGHQYIDRVTGEVLTVQSVGTKVTVKRHDAKLNTEHSVEKGVMRNAIDAEFVVHDEKRCPRCR